MPKTSGSNTGKIIRFDNEWYSGGNEENPAGGLRGRLRRDGQTVSKVFCLALDRSHSVFVGASALNRRMREAQNAALQRSPSTQGDESGTATLRNCRTLAVVVVRRSHNQPGWPEATPSPSLLSPCGCGTKSQFRNAAVGTRILPDPNVHAVHSVPAIHQGLHGVLI